MQYLGYCSPVYYVHACAKVLQLQLANAVPGFVLRRLSVLPIKKYNKINKINGGFSHALMSHLYSIVLYYGRSCAQKGKEA